MIDGAECLDLVPTLNPDVILMDLQTPCMDGIIAATRCETLLKPEILARDLAPQSRGKPESTPQTESTLTERELEVLQLAAKGKRNKEMAYKLGSTERTVNAHCKASIKSLESIRGRRRLLWRRGRDC